MTPSTSNGKIQLLKQADFVLNACGRPVPPEGVSWVDIPGLVGYTRFIADPAGTTDISGVMHKQKVPFMLRAITAQALPRDTQGAYWRLRWGNGQYFQSALTSHAMAFGFGSNRQVMIPEVPWAPGDKMFVDLLNFTSAGGPSNGYTVVVMFEGVYRFPLSGGKVLNPIDPASRYRQFVNVPQNILAPEFMFGPSCPSETPQGYQDEVCWYSSPTADLNIDGTVVSNVATVISTDADFMIQEVWGNITANTGTGNIVVRMRRGDGYALSSNFLPINSIQGPIFPELKIKAGDSISWDGYVVDGGGSPGDTLTFQMLFKGVKRRRVQ